MSLEFRVNKLCLGVYHNAAGGVTITELLVRGWHDQASTAQSQWSTEDLRSTGLANSP